MNILTYLHAEAMSDGLIPIRLMAIRGAPDWRQARPASGATGACAAGRAAARSGPATGALRRPLGSRYGKQRVDWGGLAAHVMGASGMPPHTSDRPCTQCTSSRAPSCWVTAQRLQHVHVEDCCPFHAFT